MQSCSKLLPPRSTTWRVLSPTWLDPRAPVCRIVPSNWSESSVSGWVPRPDQCCSRAAAPARPIRGESSPARPAVVPAPRANACPARRRSSCTAARSTPLITHLQTPPSSQVPQCSSQNSPKCPGACVVIWKVLEAARDLESFRESVPYGVRQGKFPQWV